MENDYRNITILNENNPHTFLKQGYGFLFRKGIDNKKNISSMQMKEGFKN
jgi:hypothetical protein